MQIVKLQTNFEKLFLKCEEVEKGVKDTKIPKSRKMFAGFSINKKMKEDGSKFIQILADIRDDLNKNLVVPYHRAQNIDPIYVDYVNKTRENMGSLWQKLDERYRSLTKALTQSNLTGLFNRDERLTVQDELRYIHQFFIWPEIIDIYTYFELKIV